MHILRAISRNIDILNEWVGRITYWIVPLMVLIGAWNVFGRFVGQAINTNLTSNALVETQWYMYDLVFLLGAAYTLRHDAHVRVDVFYGKWSPRRKAIVNLIGTLFFLIPFCIFVIISSWHFVTSSWAIFEQSPDPSGLPRYPIKSMIIVCYALLLVQGISEALKSLLTLLGQPQQQPQTQPQQEEPA